MNSIQVSLRGLTIDTPKYQWKNNQVNREVVDLLFGMNTQLFLRGGEEGGGMEVVEEHHQEREVDLIHVSGGLSELEPQVWEEWLGRLDKESVYRVKAMVPQPSPPRILNWAFGRWTWTFTQEEEEEGRELRMTIMGIDLEAIEERVRLVFPGSIVVLSKAGHST